MDWQLFWAAFGAIGTTIGSLITAIAVVIAVRQYRQPLTKKLKITFGSAFPIFNVGNLGESLYYIRISNVGIRTVVISNVYLSDGDKKIILNNLDNPTYIKNPNFPIELAPENGTEFYYSVLTLSNAIEELCLKMKLSVKRKIRIWVIDETGYNHILKTSLTIKKLIESKK